MRLSQSGIIYGGLVWGWCWAFSREVDQYSFPHSEQAWMDKPQQIYEMC